MDKYEFAFNEWHEKTQWVQDDKRFDVLLPWGKHRADVLKEYIDHVEAKCAALTAELKQIQIDAGCYKHGMEASNARLAQVAEVRAGALPAEVMAAIQKVARIRLDLNDFDGDKRGILDCLGEAEESLIEIVNKFAAQLRQEAAQ